MSKFLLTGARAPVTLEISRNLAKHNHEVYLADSLRFPIAKNSNSIKKSFYVRQPRFKYAAFIDDLIDIIIKHKIDYLIPTCEEVFYISHAKDKLSKCCNVICTDFNSISKMHDKYTILSMIDGCGGVIAPGTKIVKYKDVNNYSSLFEKLILKKRFCRFGTDVIVNLDAKKVSKLKLSDDDEVLLQNKIIGEEYCSYSVAVDGVLTAHCTYLPRYRLSGSASLYFKPVFNNVIYEFVKLFVKKHRYTGQISFDFIANTKGMFLIECNPRASSGVHLLSDDNLASIFVDSTNIVDANVVRDPAAIKLLMLIMMLPLEVAKFNLNTWWSDFKIAKDVISMNGDKGFFLYQIISLAELVYLSIKLKKSMRVVATYDIEWDGDNIV